MESVLYNLTGIDLELYFSVSTAGNALLFLLLLPTLILSVLCVLALLFAEHEDINWKMRVLLINIFAAEISSWIAYSAFLLGFPTRASDEIYDDVSCRIGVSAAMVTFITRLTAIALYAIVVYVFLKYGIKKVKWSIIVVAILTTWIAASVVGMVPYFAEFNVNNAGFCEGKPGTILYRTTISLVVTEMLLAMCTAVAFGLLTFCYVRKNTLEGNVEVKKTLLKHMFFLIASAVLFLITNLLPAVFPVIRAALVDHVIVSIILVHYSLRMFTILVNMITPVVTIIVLKPIRPALKQMCMKIRKNEEQATDEINISIYGGVTELQAAEKVKNSEDQTEK